MKSEQNRESVIIIGGGAAGMMAGVSAGETKIPAIILERRHRTGLKLLMCGNNRCNISHDAAPREMLTAYGTKMGSFLEYAIRNFSPDALRTWFASYGLKTVVKKGRVYPVGENADDVLHLFTDQLREMKVPLTLNCPVASITPQADNSWLINTENGLCLQAKYLLLATGGLSYPKTGSVGDGQRMAAELKHTVTELKPALAAMEVATPFHGTIEEATVTVTNKNGALIAKTKGGIIGDGTILRGSAIFDASRLIAHAGADISQCLVQAELAPRKLSTLKVESIRPLKEAITTSGGIELEQINPETMESKLYPNLFFAGEVMDIDGPTGGYNLHAAFATARLAIKEIARRIKGASPADAALHNKAYTSRHAQQTPPQKQNGAKARYQDPRSSIHSHKR